MFVDDTNADRVFQGWNGDEATQDQCRAHGPIADNEGVVRIPARMVSMIRKACDDAERRAAAQLP
ncbi:hypothetical protein ABZ734_04120 [Streptomyces sp. NPDC006660]|uniref:hypothetical protein n=1 Tax=Streptomyces sp. NPDC006660 TaxID=3156901 RepID=UPI0033D0DD67